MANKKADFKLDEKKDIDMTCLEAAKMFSERGLKASVWYDKDEGVYKCADQTGLWKSHNGGVWTKIEDAKVEDKVNDVRSYNVGESDYSKHKIQPWDIWIEYKLNPFDADIIKRVLRHKKTDSRKTDYEKIIHICQERIRQIDNGEDVWEDKNV